MTAVSRRRSSDRQSFPYFRRLAVATAMCGALSLIAVDKIGAGTTWLVSFTIDSDSRDVLSDGDAYTDYRLLDPSVCVQADQSPTGGVFAVFNRQTDSLGNRCNPTGHSDRQFRIRINAQSACERIFDAYGQLAVDQRNAPCELFYNDDPRVRMERVFSNQTRTAAAFLTRMSGNPVSYEIRTDSDATVSSQGPNRLVTYLGKAHLWEFGGASKTGPVADAFDLVFKMTFTRFPQ